MLSVTSTFMSLKAVYNEKSMNSTSKCSLRKKQNSSISKNKLLKLQSQKYVSLLHNFFSSTFRGKVFFYTLNMPLWNILMQVQNCSESII